MDELSSNHKKRSIDKIIEQMTADVQNSDGQYNQLGFTSPVSPSNTHTWPEYATASVNNGSFSHYISHSPVVANSTDNTVYYTDFPYEIDVSSHMSKQTEMLQQSGYYYPPPPRQQMNVLHENRELIGTMLDVGGGNVVNVVYGSRSQPVGSGGMMPQSYHMLASDNTRDVVSHSLGGFVPYHQDMMESTSSNQLDDFGLFGSNDQQQTQTLHQPQQHYRPLQGANRGQLIENLVGNWVPNQSGTYSPFGCTDPGICPVPSTIQQTTQTVPEHSDGENDSKGIGRGVRKTRIIAEVKPMRPSYSDVLTKSAPVTLNNSTPTTKQNSGNINTSSNITSKMENNSGGKIKGNIVSKGNAKKNKTNLLKRQLSSGSEEQTGNGNSAPTKIIRSPTMPRKSTGGEAKSQSTIAFNSLPRKWVSLDDLDSDKQGTLGEDVFHAEEVRTKSNTSTVTSKNSPSDSLQYRKISSTPRSKSGQQEEKWEGGTLNNHKAASSPSAVPTSGGNSNKSNSVGANTGSTNKRPIQINNNLGTPVWGQNRTGSAKTSKTGSDDKKGAGTISKGDAKCSGTSSGRAGTSGRSGGSGSSSASQNGMSVPEKLVQGKRGQRCRKRALHSPIAMVCQPVRQQAWRWAQMVLSLLLWFMLLLSDVLSMSSRLLAHLCMLVCAQMHSWSLRGYFKVTTAMYQMSLWPRNWWKNSSKSSSNSKSSGSKVQDGIPASLESNISLPCTGEEAMKRLLACKGKDPYSILGVTPHSSDDDIKKYYKRQAFLVHPDKNNQPGAEEAFKILVHAFELIGEPERRKAYHRRVAETQQVEQAWSELNDLLSQLHQKMEYAANTIRCTNCGKRHRRISVDRPCYAARLCAQCKIHHSAREGDIWAESSMLGFLWHYYACMDGAIYDITEWAACQADNLRHLRANTHTVQYRIVLGRQQAPPRHRGQEQSSDADLENFLNNLYSNSGGGGTGEACNSRGDQGRNRRKGKRKK